MAPDLFLRPPGSCCLMHSIARLYPPSPELASAPLAAPEPVTLAQLYIGHPEPSRAPQPPRLTPSSALVHSNKLEDASSPPLAAMAAALRRLNSPEPKLFCSFYQHH